MGRQATTGFAKLPAHLDAIAGDGLRAAFREGDALVEGMRAEGLELAYEDAGASTFDGALFRSCLFERVDFRGCTFRDTVFEGCRFIGCTMDKGWLNRVDMRDCSAPGLSLLQARLAGVLLMSSDLSYANLSESSIDRLDARETKLREAALQRAKLKHVRLEGCDLTRVDVFGTNLAGIDVSTCLFQVPVLSADHHELRGARVSVEQAVDLVRLIGVRIADEDDEE